MAELTLGTAFFLILVLVPGYLALWASGRVAGTSESFKEALYRGIFMFAVVMLSSLVVELISKAVSAHPLRAADNLLALLRGIGGFADSLAIWLIIFYVTALFLGFIDLWLSVRAVRILKAQMWLRNWLAKETPFEISPREDALFYIFLYYRLAGKRPYVTAWVEGRTHPLQGEIIKVAWGKRGGVLVLGADDPRNVEWVPLAALSSIRFENAAIGGGVEALLPRWLREWLEMVHPGLAAEIEAKMVEKERQKGM